MDGIQGSICNICFSADAVCAFLFLCRHRVSAQQLQSIFAILYVYKHIGMRGKWWRERDIKCLPIQWNRFIQCINDEENAQYVQAAAPPAISGMSLQTVLPYID